MAVALAAAVGACAGATYGASTGAGTTLKVGQQPAFVPQLGDWEGQLGALHVSFSLVAEPAGPAAGASAYGIANLVLPVPGGCPPKLEAATTASFLVFPTAPPLAVASDGTFPFAATPLRGSISGARRAQALVSYAVASQPGCAGTLHFTMTPADRLALDDGTWTLTTAQGTSSTFTVTGDGRVLEGLAVAPAVPACPNGSGTAFSGQLSIFVGPGGKAGELLSGPNGQVRVAVQFVTADSARGTFTATKPGCRSGVLSFTAQGPA